jgi:nucleotide-binding universal stress UspA family protein
MEIEAAPRAAGRSRMVRHIMVAVDGSAGSRKAAGFAKSLAQDVGARLTLIYVLEPPPVVVVGFPEVYGLSHRQPTDEELDAVKKMLDEVAADFPHERVDKVVEFGVAAQTILDQCESRRVDLLVIGARGLGPMERWLLGSVSDRLVHHSKCPVTVVH